MTKIKSLIIRLAAALVLLVPAVPVAVSAQGVTDCLNGSDASIGACLDSGSCIDDEDCQQDAGESVNNIVNTIINVFSLIVGIVSVIMIIIGGFQYITSGGDSGKVGNAKNTILYAIVGLVIVALAQVIVRFVLDQTTV